MSYRMSQLTHSRQQKGTWEQPEPATPATVRSFSLGRLGRSLPQPRSETYSEHLARTTPLPRKLRRRQIPSWIIPAMIVTAIFIASVLLWHWYGTQPR